MGMLLNVAAFDFTNFFDRAADVIKNFHFLDAIEILIVTLLFFWAFRFLKGRKAFALILGVLICFVFYSLSVILEFRVLESMLSALVASGAIVIIVVFQPEIREALEKIGNGSLSGLMSFGDRKKKKELYYSVIENICAAVKEMSAESTGALIVIERTTRLSDVASTGIAINADVRALLIRNLFVNKAPLHDGAIVIMDARIAAAGCFLPLSRRADIDPDLGTRHRAAIGMSETSDAIIIIVSEETGRISVAHDCDLKRDLTVEELNTYLTDNIIRTSGNS